LRREAGRRDRGVGRRGRRVVRGGLDRLDGLVVPTRADLGGLGGGRCRCPALRQAFFRNVPAPRGRRDCRVDFHRLGAIGRERLRRGRRVGRPGAGEFRSFGPRRIDRRFCGLRTRVVPLCLRLDSRGLVDCRPQGARARPSRRLALRSVAGRWGDVCGPRLFGGHGGVLRGLASFDGRAAPPARIGGHWADPRRTLRLSGRARLHGGYSRCAAADGGCFGIRPEPHGVMALYQQPALDDPLESAAIGDVDRRRDPRGDGPFRAVAARNPCRHRTAEYAARQRGRRGCIGCGLGGRYGTAFRSFPCGPRDGLIGRARLE